MTLLVTSSHTIEPERLNMPNVMSKREMFSRD